MVCCKTLHQKLTKIGKKKSGEVINQWIRSIGNNFLWAYSTCDGSEQILREKWCSILCHIQDKHHWTENIVFHSRTHPDLSKQTKEQNRGFTPR